MRALRRAGNVVVSTNDDMLPITEWITRHLSGSLADGANSACSPVTIRPYDILIELDHPYRQILGSA